MAEIIEASHELISSVPSWAIVVLAVAAVALILDAIGMRG